MNLIPKEIQKQFEKYPIYSQEGKMLEAKLLVKYFNPFGRGTWMITEAEPMENGDWRLFGLVHIFEWEWGYVLLSELQNLGCIERDFYAEDTVREQLLADGHKDYVEYLEAI